MNGSGKARTMLGTLSLVAIGAVIGVTGDRLLHSGAHLDALHDHLGQRQELHEQALTEFQERLHLDASQRAEIDSVFRLHQGSIDAAWEDLQPRVQSAVDSVHAHIESILRPDQREAFRAWLAAQTGDGSAGTH